MKPQNQKKQPIITKIVKANEIKIDRNILYFIAAFAFLLYVNTIPHKYALDDSYVVLENEYTKKGFEGIGKILSTDMYAGVYAKYGGDHQMVVGGRYRPFSVVSLAIEYEFFGENPYVSHFVNILLYVLTCVLLYIILRRVLKDVLPEHDKPFMGIAFISTMLFAAHPLHTEVIANIKGRDEILTLLGAMFSMYFVFQYTDYGKIKHLVFACISFFLALLSKENAAAFLFIIPLALYYFRKQNIKKIFYSSIPMWVVFLFFMIIRQSVIGSGGSNAGNELMNNPFLGTSFTEKYATIFYTLGLYLKLLIFPHPLTFDYYPKHIPIIEPSDLRAIIPLLMYLAIGIYGLLAVIKKQFYGFAIWVFLIPLSIVSNIFFPIGAFMGERFLYISTIGFALTVSYFLYIHLPKFIHNTKLQSYIAMSVVTAILIGFSAKTFTRNFAWKDSLTLFETDVKTSVNSIKSNSGLGEMYYHMGEGKPIEERNKFLLLSKKHLDKSVQLHPDYVNALVLLANVHYILRQDADSAIYYYLRIARVSPNFIDLYRNLPVLTANFSVDKKIQVYSQFQSYNPSKYDPNYALGFLYAKEKGDLPKGIFYLEKALAANPKSIETLKSLGLAYGINKDILKAKELFEKAYILYPNDVEIRSNLALTYTNLGMPAKAIELIAKH